MIADVGADLAAARMLVGCEGDRWGCGSQRAIGRWQTSLVPVAGNVCLFCGATIEPMSESCRLTLEADWTASAGTYWSHGPCLQMASHPSIPLYLLSLTRDEAVYGSRPEQANASDGTRVLSEREAFRAARIFLAQFNERERSDSIDLLVSWMTEETWGSNPLETADPAQWHDWMRSVDQVIAERSDHVGET